MTEFYSESVFRPPMEVPSESVTLYCRLWQLETWLREMVYAELKSAFGTSWSTKLKSHAQAQPIRDRKVAEKKLIHMATAQENPLAFRTIGELFSLIRAGDLWRFFEGYFPPEVVLEGKLRELFAIRNRVAHFRTPHKDDVNRVIQFLRDVDQGFWRFCASLNDRHPVTPDEQNELQERFARLSGFQLIEVEPNTWMDFGHRDKNTLFNLTIRRSYRPWLRNLDLANPMDTAPGFLAREGVIYNACFAISPGLIDYSELLRKTKELHETILYVALEGYGFSLALPSVAGCGKTCSVVQGFAKQIPFVVQPGMPTPETLDRDRVAAESAAALWPEYVLPPSSPLVVLTPTTPCSFFGV